MVARSEWIIPAGLKFTPTEQWIMAQVKLANDTALAVGERQNTHEHEHKVELAAAMQQLRDAPAQNTNAKSMRLMVLAAWAGVAVNIVLAVITHH